MKLFQSVLDEKRTLVGEALLNFEAEQGVELLVENQEEFEEEIPPLFHNELQEGAGVFQRHFGEAQGEEPVQEHDLEVRQLVSDEEVVELLRLALQEGFEGIFEERKFLETKKLLELQTLEEEFEDLLVRAGVLRVKDQDCQNVVHSLSVVEVGVLFLQLEEQVLLEKQHSVILEKLVAVEGPHEVLVNDLLGLLSVHLLVATMVTGEFGLLFVELVVEFFAPLDDLLVQLEFVGLLVDFEVDCPELLLLLLFVDQFDYSVDSRALVLDHAGGSARTFFELDKSLLR